jgi:hypothetical protein
MLIIFELSFLKVLVLRDPITMEVNCTIPQLIELSF